MKTAILLALQSGARVTLSAAGHGNTPVVLLNGEPVIADGDNVTEMIFTLALVGGGPVAAAWGVKLSIEF